MRPPIISRKHLVQFTEFTVPSLDVGTQVAAKAVAIQDVNANFEVMEGAVIKAIFIELWILGAASNQSSFVLIVEKSVGDQPNPSLTDLTNLDSYDNKKNILFTSQGLIAPSSANPTPVLRQWIKIPKGKTRFGLDDELKLHIAAIGGQALQGCGLHIYKEYR